MGPAAFSSSLASTSFSITARFFESGWSNRAVGTSNQSVDGLDQYPGHDSGHHAD
jgi:hypothetical protein